MYVVMTTHDRQPVATTPYGDLAAACHAARAWVRQGGRCRVSYTPQLDPTIVMQYRDGGRKGLGYTATVYHDAEQFVPRAPGQGTRE